MTSPSGRRPTRRHRGRIASIATLAAGAAFLVMSCWSESTDPRPEYPQEYVDYWEVVLSTASDMEDPASALARVARGQQLRSLVSGIRQDQAEGMVTVGTVDRRLLDVLTERGRTYVVDCLDLSNWLIADAASGQPLEDQQVNAPDQAYVFTLAERDGKWFVTDSEVIGSCANGG